MRTYAILAARVAARRSAGRATELLAGGVGGCCRAAGAADRRARPAVQSYRGASDSVRYPGRTDEGNCRRLSQSEGVTLFMTLLAAFQLLLCKYSASGRGGWSERRSRTAIARETEGLIGFFVNTWCCANDVSGEPSFRELMKQVREVTLGAYAHQDMPFEKLVEELQPERDMSRAPLFQVKLVMQNAPRKELKLDDLELEKFEMEVVQAKYDLSVFLEEKDGVIQGEMEYACELFEAESVEHLLRHFEGVVGGGGERRAAASEGDDAIAEGRMAATSGGVE